MTTTDTPRKRRRRRRRISARPYSIERLFFAMMPSIGPEGVIVGQYQAIVDELKAKREELGLTQEQLDLKLGLTRGHVGKLEIRTRIARSDFLALWALGLGFRLALQPAQTGNTTRQS